ncbi:carboxypeptidase regulatory-like domain-containing protein [Dactylosporangium sp. CA-139114]|uniref:carboxypeptidase regulatory-like domain-containing protein n=1 Tax=Dactylosporangium sp. CA-139114 TaxID=3239931 RepID=UPI003D9866B1
MRQHALRRSLLSAAATATIIGVMAVPSGPAFAAGTATITGHLTGSSGQPLANAAVQVSNSQETFQVTTDASGAYSAPGLDAGSYTVSFVPAGAQFRQYAHQKRTWETADQIAVAAGATVVVDDQALPSGRITGSLHKRDGSPVAGAYLTAYTAGEQVMAGTVNTAADGTFSFELLPGTYKIEFYQYPLVYQWNGGTFTSESAAAITVVAGQATPLAETVIATGSIAGQLLKADGTPAAGVNVSANVPDGPGRYATTGADGRYRMDDVPVRADWYVAFRGPGGRTQYAHGKLTQESADRVAVTEGQVTTVDDQLLPTGSVRLVAHDATTGAPLTGFCAWEASSSVGGCAETTELVVADMFVGTWHFSVNLGDHRHFDVIDQPAVVTAGQTTTVDVAMRLGASLTVPMTARASGAAADGCAQVARSGGEFPVPYGSGCSDWQSPPTPGSVLIGPLEPGTYQVFADPGDGALGSQWVGATGGTGDRDAAASVTLAAGDQATLAPVRFDGAGSIRGTVTDVNTGAPVPYACVSVVARTPGFSGDGCNQATATDGTYTIGGLGPYAWPVQFSHQAYQWRWSGNKVTRPEATKVTVRVGKSVAANIKLRTGGGTVTGTIKDAAGHTIDGMVIAYNAVTGEAVSLGAYADGGGPYALSLLAAPQPVKLFYSAGFGHSGWAGGTDFASATTYQVRNNRTTTANIVVP